MLDSEGRGNGGEMAKLQISELPLFSGIIYSEILIKLTRLVIIRLFTKGHLL